MIHTFADCQPREDKKLDDVNEGIERLINARPYGNISDQILCLHSIYKKEINPKYKKLLFKIEWSSLVRMDTMYCRHKDTTWIT